MERTAADVAEDEAFCRLYGDWASLTPREVAAELHGFDRPWWVVGGWAIEAATGFRREHEDTDISLLSCDVEAFVEHLAGRWDVWNNVGGVLHPLGGRWKTVDEPASQLWLRRDANSPWVLDIPLTPSDDGEWTNKRLEAHVAPVADVTWVDGDGIRYLLPEIVLVYKARLRRQKDQPDFAATVPTLTPERRAWTRRALAEAAPGHPWITALEGAGDGRSPCS